MFAVWMSDKFPAISNKNYSNIFSTSGFMAKKVGRSCKFGSPWHYAYTKSKQRQWLSRNPSDKYEPSQFTKVKKGSSDL